jgi:hypothetical protein
MPECVIHPFEGIELVGRGTIAFGSSLDGVLRVLGDLESRLLGSTRLYVQNEAYALRFDVDANCDAIEFIDATGHPPVMHGHLVPPVMREAAELLQRFGDAPWSEEGPIENLRRFCTPTYIHIALP